MLTFYQHFTKYRRQKNEDFDNVFLSWDHDRKESEEGEKFSKQMCVSSQKIRMRKEEGATAAATPTFPQRADATVVRKRAVRQ